MNVWALIWNLLMVWGFLKDGSVYNPGCNRMVLCCRGWSLGGAEQISPWVCRITVWGDSSMAPSVKALPGYQVRLCQPERPRRGCLSTPPRDCNNPRARIMLAEPLSPLAEWKSFDDLDERIVLWLSTVAPFHERKRLAFSRKISGHSNHFLRKLLP